MFHRAQRNWLPLITSHIRLRNLIKITAHNLTFHCDNDDPKSEGNFSAECYFTLHLSAFSKPFYTSACVEVRNGKINWPEINCELCRESSQKFICIRVWQKSASQTSADKMLFLWGVYFSGLVLVPQDSSKFKDNTLLFELDGGIFTSSDQIIYHIKSDRDEIIPITMNAIEEVEKFNCDKNLTHHLSNGNNNINLSSSPLTKSISSSPVIHEENDKKASNAMDILINYPKVRYVQLKFSRNEMQQSYTLERLMQMQEIQREISELRKKTKTLAERICMKSPACLNLDLITTAKPIFYEPQKQPGMGRALSRLLAQVPPKPEVLLKSHELRIKIECARFRIKLLSQERDRCRQNNKQLEAKREKLKDDNTETETFIWNNLRTLNRENLRAYDEKLALQRETFMNVKLALLETRRNLLKDLNEIYFVKKCDRIYTINGIYLPDAESYNDTQVSAVEISVALGYVAHCVLIISRILNVPLRNPIKHEGSRSRIIDTIKILPPTDRM